MGVGRLVAKGVSLNPVGPYAEKYGKDEESGERWITIGGEPNEEKGTKHEGGTPVKIDSEGNIKAGPGWLKKKGIDELSDFGKKEGTKPKPSSKPLTIAEMRERFGKGQELDTPNGPMVSEGLTLGNTPVVRARDENGTLHQFSVDELTGLQGGESEPDQQQPEDSKKTGRKTARGVDPYAANEALNELEGKPHDEVIQGLADRFDMSTEEAQKLFDSKKDYREIAGSVQETRSKARDNNLNHMGELSKAISGAQEGAMRLNANWHKMSEGERDSIIRSAKASAERAAQIADDEIAKREGRGSGEPEESPAEQQDSPIAEDQTAAEQPEQVGQDVATGESPAEQFKAITDEMGRISAAAADRRNAEFEGKGFDGWREARDRKLTEWMTPEELQRFKDLNQQGLAIKNGGSQEQAQDLSSAEPEQPSAPAEAPAQESPAQESQWDKRPDENYGQHADRIIDAHANGEEVPEDALRQASEFAKVGTADYRNDFVDVKPSDIPLSAAIAAHSGTSFVPERRGRQRQQDYAQAVANFARKFEGMNLNDDQKEIVKSELQRFKDNYRSAYLAALGADSRTMSSMITGPARFPTRSNEKRMASAMNRWNDVLSLPKKAEKSIMRKLEGAKTESQKSSEETRRLKRDAERMLAVVKGIKSGEMKGYDVSAFRNSIQGKILRSAQNGNVDAVREVLDHVKDLQEKTGVTLFAPRNRVWDAVSQAENAQQKSEEVRSADNAEIEYSGGTMVQNTDDDRVQLHFPGKPSAEVRSKLKSAGFRWSPRNQAWQRKLTSNGVYAAKNVMKDLFGEPEQNRKNGEPVRYSRNPACDLIASQIARYAKGDNPKSDGKAEWITIGGEPDGKGKKHVGGTPVKVTDSGDIVAGPKALADKGIKNLNDFGRKGELSDSGGQKGESEDADNGFNFKPNGEFSEFGDSGIRLAKDGRRVWMDGNTYGYKDDIKAAGGHWDSGKRMWWIGSGKNWDKLYQKLQGRAGDKKEYKEEAQRRKSNSSLGVTIPFKMSDLRQDAKRAGAIWNRDKKQWMFKTAEDAEKFDQMVKSRLGGGGSQKIASDKQKAIIRGARREWFDLFDGASGYDIMNGPTDEQINKMTSKEASELISAIFDQGYNPRDYGYRRSYSKHRVADAIDGMVEIPASQGGRKMNYSRHSLANSIAIQVAKYAKDPTPDGKAEWITIGGEPDGKGKKHVGGTPVKVTDSGEIVAGPKALADKGIKNLNDFGKGKGGEKDGESGSEGQSGSDPESAPEATADDDGFDDRLTELDAKQAESKLQDINGDIENAEYSLNRANQVLQSIERDESRYDDPSDYPYSLKDARKEQEKRKAKAEKELEQAQELARASNLREAKAIIRQIVDHTQGAEDETKHLTFKPKPEKSRNSRRASGHVWDSYQRQDHTTNHTTQSLFLHVFNQKAKQQVYPSRPKSR